MLNVNAEMVSWAWDRIKHARGVQEIIEFIIFQVPVQRVTRYPLLLARLLKVTAPHHPTRDELQLAHEKIEQHLDHMNKVQLSAFSSNQHITNIKLKVFWFDFDSQQGRSQVWNCGDEFLWWMEMGGVTTATACVPYLQSIVAQTLISMEPVFVLKKYGNSLKTVDGLIVWSYIPIWP